MLAQLREAVRDALPPKIVHAYRVARHTMLWPTELEMVTARQYLSPDKVAVDVGANFGLFTSVLARHARAVVAFEPNPGCARYLESVMPANCEIIAKAVSDRAGTTMLRVPVSGGVAMDALATIETANRFDSETRATDFTEHPVETVTLDQVLLDPERSGTSVGFINIDAEGHEFAVLRGGESLIAAHRPVLLVELEYRHGAAVAEIFDWLDARHYAPRALIDGHTLAPIDATALRGLQNEERLVGRLAGKRHAGYVNNIFFLPT
jgi:FkbM family methyltransferase